MSGYSFNAVINAIALIPITGVTVMTVAPKFGQECLVPAIYPSLSPSVTLQSVERQSSTGRVAGKSFKIEHWQVSYIYLHKEVKQDGAGGTPGTDNSQYEAAIRANMSDIFNALDDHDTSLGVEEVQPGGFSIAERLIEIGGRTYLGGQITLNITEYDQGT